jgi:hypothetical protein
MHQHQRYVKEVSEGSCRRKRSQEARKNVFGKEGRVRDQKTTKKGGKNETTYHREESR